MASQQHPPFAYPTSSDYENSQSKNQSVTQVPLSQSRQAAEEARKDRTLAEFLLMLDDYEPLVCLFVNLGFVLLQWNSRFRMKLRTIFFNALALNATMLACV